MYIYEQIRKEIAQQLDDYLIEFQEFTHAISQLNDEIEVHLEIYEQFFSYYIKIEEDWKQVYISRAYLPEELQNKGITLNLIKFVYEAAKKHNFDTFVAKITNSKFHQSLLRRGALPTSSDTVQIVESTNLLK